MSGTTPEYAIDPEPAPILAALPTGAPSSDFEQNRRLTREIVAQMPAVLRLGDGVRSVLMEIGPSVRRVGAHRTV